jgi:ribosomal protein L11 methylase PrmA
VLVADGHVYRTIMPAAAADHDDVRRTGILEELATRGWVIDERPVDKAGLGSIGGSASYVVEHPKLAFISYPYEWCFHALKDAALLHLDVHLHCLDKGITLTDASAYNIQFQGPKPIFIDTLSFRPYRDGEIWVGHRQFCDQFVNPLLLRALLGIPHNAWYRGSMEGIPVQHLANALPFRSKFSWNAIKHVILQAALERLSTKSRVPPTMKEVRLPRASLRAMLSGLRSWIGSLETREGEATVWRHYAEDNSYQNDEARKKAQFIREFSAATRPAILWDLGCNTGEYSKVALGAGAAFAIGFDFDIGAVERAYARAKAEKLSLLPLHLDITNPSPSQGWAQHERKGLNERGPADALLALALVHHLAIAKNVPLSYVVDWLVGLARSGVIEFVQKDDPMIRQLLRFREDIFQDYSEENFRRALSARARIQKFEQVSATGRTLYWFERD